MKKGRMTPTFIICVISLLIVGSLSFFYSQNKILSDDNKSKNVVLKTANKIPVLSTLLAKNLAKQQAQSEANDESLLTVERVYTEQEINEMTEDGFLKLLEETQKKLPKLSDIKELPAGALHRTPTIVLQAGRDLGVIKEVLKVHESYEKIVTPFYKTCAKDEQGTTPVRALCLTNLIFIKKKNNEKINLKEYPNRLIELSKMVTDI